MSTTAWSWNELRVWLAANDVSRLRGLRGGASAKDLKLLRSKWPGLEDHPLCADLALANGESWHEDFMLGDMARLLSVTEILDLTTEFEWIASRKGELDSACGIRTLGPVKDCGWNSKWVPFLTSNVIPFCIDLDPAPGGSLGQVIRLDVEDVLLAVVAPTYEDFARTCTAAVKGGYRFPFDF